ncbi:response regulator [Halorussus amylolyticus]|uniref:response regulator n=1 Tax=Halorussus amylolyticus TaxID=1126242 RepID=UPI001EE4C1A4|nr:HalX domain-containing protein [Halorussus amylolyticus]
MDSDDSEQSTVLIVDDEPALVTTFAAWLESEYDVRQATCAEEAREKLSGADIVLLDRKMPDTTGDELLEEIQARDVDVEVGMLTAVEPDIDDMDMSFDAYEVKPIGSEELLSLVQSLEQRATYGDQLRELYTLAVKRATLIDTQGEAELAESPKFASLTRRLTELRERTDESLREFTGGKYDAAFRMLRESDND